MAVLPSTPLPQLELLRNIASDTFAAQSSSPANFLTVDYGDLFGPHHTLYFTANDAVHGEELWATDGTPDGTQLVHDINPGAASADPRLLMRYRFGILFSAKDASGNSLWQAEEGYITPKYEADTFGFPNVSILTSDPFDPNISLWMSDGTNLNVIAGIFLPDSPGEVAVEPTPRTIGKVVSIVPVGFAGEDVVLAADNGHGVELLGARLLIKQHGGSGPLYSDFDVFTIKDINPQGSSNPSNFTFVNNTLFFTADKPGSGTELWKTDGTAAGTKMVKDIRGGKLGSNPSDLINVNGTLYFTADDGKHGRELWKSNGTAAGTVMVADINAHGSSDPADLTMYHGQLYFSAHTSINGTELWRTNGKASGTTLLRDIDPYNADGSNPHNLTVVGDNLYFAADDGDHGVEVWVSDGTWSGTKLHTDINPGPNGSDPHELTEENGQLFLAANDGVHGIELFRSGDYTFPVVNHVPDQSNDAGDQVSLALFAQDADGDPLTFTATGLPPGLHIDANTGVISGTVDASAVSNSPYSVRITVMDDDSNITAVNNAGPEGASFTWTITDTTPPSITNPGNRLNREGDQVSLQIQASDSDADPLTYSASGLPPGLAINPSTGLVSGTVLFGAAGTYDVTIGASDGANHQTVLFKWGITPRLS